MNTGKPLTVSKPNTKVFDTHVRVSTRIDDDLELWFEVSREHEDFLSDRMDYLALALLPVAMMSGRNIHLDGEVTDTLLHQLNQLAQPLIQEIYSDWKQIRISASNPSAPLPAADGVATGFSGGVDSFSALQTYHLNGSAPQSRRITYLLNNNVGSFHRAGGRAAWHAAGRKLSPVAQEVGLPFIMVDSNLEDFYPQGMEFKYFHTLCNAAVPHLLSKGIGHLYYASAYSYRQVLQRGTKEGTIGHLDPLLLPLLSTPAVTLTSADPEKNRVEKTLALTDSPYRHYLDVCTSSDATRLKNCSRCEKCMRTQITLDIHGSLDDFMPEAFDREIYLKYRVRHIAKILSDKGDLSREVVDFAKNRGYRWPWRSVLGRFLVPMYLKIKEIRQPQPHSVSKA